MSTIGFWANNPGAEERLCEMHDAGLSFGEIGRKLGCGKNSVVSKAHRLGLPARPSPIIRDGKPHPYRRRVVVRSPAALPTLLSLFDDPILLSTPPSERSAPKPKPVVEALPVVRESKRRCDWLEGDKPFIRCCGMAQFGKSYCLAHHKIAYRRLHDLRDEAA